MSMPPTPPVPKKAPWHGTSLRVRIIFGLAVFQGACVVTAIILRLLGLIIPYHISTAAMSPAISRGDNILMEGFTFLARQPRRGDIIAFKTDGIAQIAKATTYAKRIAGEPGEHLTISEGRLYINGALVELTNQEGGISFALPSGYLPTVITNIIIPPGQYFVTGDNSIDSFDSRFWGCVPTHNIRGRLGFCFWPPERMGWVK